MSTIEKLKKRFNENPIRNDITINEVVRLAKYYGCLIVTGGNHQIRIVHKPSGTVIPIPNHDNSVKRAYIMELNELFNSIENNGGDEND